MTKEKIYQAALRLFARKGFEATSIRDIAVEAEVTSSTLYHYMKTKEDLLISIMREGMRFLIGNANAMLAELDEPVQQLAALVQMHVTGHALEKLTTLVIDNEFRALTGEARTEVEALRNEYESLWKTVLDKGIAHGVFSVESSKLAVFALLQMCTGVAHWYSPDGPHTLQEIRNVFANMALALVQANHNGRQLSLADVKIPDQSRFFNKSWLEEEQ